MTQDEMKNLKKIDLHCHLDGSLSEETIQKMAQNNGILLPEREELFQRLCAGDDCQDLKEYLDCFEIPLSLLQTEENDRCRKGTDQNSQHQHSIIHAVTTF